MQAVIATHSLDLIPAIEAYQKRGDATLLKRIAAGFARFTDGVICACIGAIDGVQIAIRKPALADAPNPTA